MKNSGPWYSFLIFSLLNYWGRLVFSLKNYCVLFHRHLTEFGNILLFPRLPAAESTPHEDKWKRRHHQDIQADPRMEYIEKKYASVRRCKKTQFSSLEEQIASIAGLSLFRMSAFCWLSFKVLTVQRIWLHPNSLGLPYRIFLSQPKLFPNSLFRGNKYKQYKWRTKITPNAVF